MWLNPGMANIFRETRKRELNTTTDTAASAVHSYAVSPLSQPKRQSQSLDHIKIARNKGSPEENITEGDIVRQLIFIFGNTTSTDIEGNSRWLPNQTQSGSLRYS